MSMAAHAAAAGALRLGCSRSQQVLCRAAEGTSPAPPGPGKRLERLGPGRGPRPHPDPLLRQHPAPTAGQRPRGGRKGTGGTRCHKASLRERARSRAAVDGDGGEKGGWASPSTAQNGFPGPGARPPGRAGPRSRRGPSRRRPHRGQSVLTVTAGPPRRPGQAGPGRAARSRRSHNTMAAARDRPTDRRGHSQLPRELPPREPVPRKGRGGGGA